MHLSDRIKIQLWIKRFTYEDLIAIQKFINDEVKTRNKRKIQ